MLILILPLIVGALVISSAMLAASETAIFSLARMEHTREQLSAPVRDAVNRMMRRPAESLIVVIGLNETCNVFASCLATTLTIAAIGAGVGPFVAAAVMLAVQLVICDITPKTFALGFPGAIAWLSARPLATLTDLVHPIVRHFAPVEQLPPPASVSESEFKALLRLGQNQGQIEPAERALIHRVFDFGSHRAAEVMTPRERTFMIDVAKPSSDIVAEIAHESFSRVPVYRGSPDNIVGILHAKDLAIRRLETAAVRIDRLVRPAYFIPPGKFIGELFDEMRRGRFQMALVVSEYGKVLGLVTLEDLLEEMFGEIRDEFDLEVPELTQTTPGEWVASGAIELKRLNAEISPDIPLAVPAGHTLSALILRRLGRVPHAGEKVEIARGIEATVERVRGAAVELARLKQ
jgi:CBS domain containing-hemolysin-like protein